MYVFPSTEQSLTLLPLQRGLHLVICFKTVAWEEGEKVTLKRRSLTNTISANWPRLMSTVTSHVGSIHTARDFVRMALYLYVPDPKAHNPHLTLRKTSGQNRWETFFQIADQYSSKLARSSKQSLKISHWPEEVKDTWCSNVF